MNVLSLFDGISCGRIALDRAGIPVTNYFSSEIDKWASGIAQYNYPTNTELGNVTTIRYEDGKLYSENFPDGIEVEIQLIIGGSPCQGFSLAGKQLNFEDPRSALFFEYYRILKEINPKWFLLENVRMRKDIKQTISDLLEFDCIEIDSSLLSAQSRKRLYWTNIPNVTQPEDKGILLQDIIQHGVVDRQKSFCLDANYWKGGNLKSYFEKHRRQLVFEYSRKTGLGKRLDKSKPLNASDWRGLNRNQKQSAVTRMIEDGLLSLRSLTPIECERLQTVPQSYSQHGVINDKIVEISKTQRYKALGNSFTVDVIAHILKGINNERPTT